MANITTNYNLNKPLPEENVNIDVLNQNMDIIDTNLKSLSDKINKVENDIPSTDGFVSQSTLNTALTSYAKKTDLPKEYDDTELSNRVNTIETNLGSHTIKSDVPENAIFTDTIYDDTALKTELTTAITTAVSDKANSYDLTSHINNTNNPHSVTKAQVGLGNVPNVTTNNQTPTYMDITDLETLTSGEKISNAFAKIKLAISNLIDHIANKTNPHGVTASQVGLGNVGNFKAVSTVADQGLTDTEKANARENIGAGTSSFSGSYSDLTNKPTIPTVGNGTVTITQNGITKGTFTMNQSGNTTVELTDNNDNTTYSEATTEQSGLMSASDKTKLDGIAEGANKTIVDSSLSSTSTNPVQNKVVNTALSGKIPTSRTVNGKALTSDITLTASDVGADASGSASSALTNAKTYTDTKIANLVGTAPEIMDTLAEVAAAIEAHQEVTDALNAAIGNKVDKVSGKGLSTNDLTDTLKSNYDAAYSHSQSDHAPSTAQANVIEIVKVNGTALTPSSKAVDITVPTKVSQLTNDSGFNTTDNNTTYSLTKSGSTITLTGSDGSTTSVTDSDTKYTHPTTSGNKHIPSGGSSGQILEWSADGTAKWVTPDFGSSSGNGTIYYQSAVPSDATNNSVWIV